MKMIKKIVLILILVLTTAVSFSQEKPAYVIYTAKGTKVNFGKMLKELSTTDVILFGELHNNPIAHWLQLELSKAIAKDKSVILGAEMLESDNQNVLNNYLNNKITLKEFKTQARLWPNYDTDYSPLVEFAKENKLSIQLAARKLRYDWFQEIISLGFDYVLTAHHLDDNVETFLINFTRGTGLEGLTGIPSQNDKIIRPLLTFSKAEIETFAQENQLKWREDSSNSSDKYLRNKIRHQVVPILKEWNPSFLDSFENTLQNLNQAQSLVEDASRIVYRKVVKDVDNQKKIDFFTI